jgi:hypothetical protein
MHVFRLSLVAGANNPRYAPGTAMDAICLVDSGVRDEARDGALLLLDRLGWESCTFRDVALFPAGPDVAGFTPAMREAYADAKRHGVALIVYPAAAPAADPPQ